MTLDIRTRAEDWFFAHAPTSVLRHIATRLAPLSRIERVPGWSFAHVELETSRRIEVRRKLWRRFRTEELVHPITVPWLDGTRLRLHLGNDLSWCVFVGGTFEPNEFAFLADFLEPRMTFVDVGANDGAYTLFAARRVGAHGRVVAIEPSSREFERLTSNLELNQLANVTTVHAAAGEAARTISLAVAEQGHEGQNTLGTVINNENVATASLEEVEMRTLDEILTTSAVDRVDFVKIDVEGSEPRVLAGAREILAEHQPILQLELEPEWLARQGSSVEEVRRLLETAGYRWWVFDDETGELRAPHVGEQIDGNVIAGQNAWRPVPTS